MKYVMTWWERPGGSYADYEAARKRVLDVFQNWEMPESLNIHQFVVRVGEAGTLRWKRMTWPTWRSSPRPSRSSGSASNP